LVTIGPYADRAFLRNLRRSFFVNAFGAELLPVIVAEDVDEEAEDVDEEAEDVDESAVVLDED
jgi:3-isopropylmalate dehydratase small subunit